VVTTRGDVHYVITEYGIADLHGKNIRERAISLIGLAHPKFRKGLLDEAKSLKYVYEDQIDLSAISSRYPDHYAHCQIIADGTEVTFRPINAADEESMRDMFYALSEKSVEMRFFQAVKSMPHARIMPLVSIDYEKDMAIVATIEDIAGEKIIGVGRYIRTSKDDKFAEVSFMVRDEWQNRGLGRAFLSSLIAIAKNVGIEGFVATVLPKNRLMMSVFRGCGYKLKVEKDEDIFELSFRFDGSV
jgi:RimJ/RimL family protein N-acetyltransferase